VGLKQILKGSDVELRLLWADEIVDYALRTAAGASLDQILMTRRGENGGELVSGV
jgi:hypothetical protein